MDVKVSKVGIARAGQNLSFYWHLWHTILKGPEEVRIWSRGREWTSGHLMIHSETFIHCCHGNSTCRQMKPQAASPQNRLLRVVSAWLKGVCVLQSSSATIHSSDSVWRKKHLLLCVCFLVWLFVHMVNSHHSLMCASSSDDNRCCWLELLLCQPSIRMLHKIQLVDFRASASTYWRSERFGSGSSRSLPFMPIQLSGISIDICICKFWHGGHAGRHRAG